MIVSDKHINPENSKSSCILKCDFGDGDIYEHVCACVLPCSVEKSLKRYETFSKMNVDGGAEGRDWERPPVEASWNDLLLWRRVGGAGWLTFWVMIQKLNSGEIYAVRKIIQA